MKIFSLFFLFCDLRVRLADFHDAGTGVVGFNLVENDSIFPFGTDFAVDDALDVAVFRVASSVNHAQNAEACNQEVVDAAFDGFGGFFGGEAVEVDFVFGVGKFPGGGIAAHFLATGGTLGSCFGFCLGLDFGEFVFVLHGVVLDPL